MKGLILMKEISFLCYLQYRNIEGMSKWQDILSIKRKKSAMPEMSYLTIEGIKLLQSELCRQKSSTNWPIYQGDRT